MHVSGVFVSRPVYRCTLRAQQVQGIRVSLTLGSTHTCVPCCPRFLMLVVDVCVITLRWGSFPFL
jgi:hypothetical protein